MSDYGTPPPPSYGAYGGQPAGGPPQNYLVWGILTTIFCCLPFGVASIVFSSQVNSKWAAGDYAGAQEASGKARQFAIWSAIAAVIIDVILVVIYVVVIAAAVSTNSTTG